MVERYRLTVSRESEAEQTETLLPDEPSARVQAEELSARNPGVRVRMYYERPDTLTGGMQRTLLLDLLRKA